MLSLVSGVTITCYFLWFPALICDRKVQIIVTVALETRYRHLHNCELHDMQNLK